MLIGGNSVDKTINKMNAKKKLTMLLNSFKQTRASTLESMSNSHTKTKLCNPDCRTKDLAKVLLFNQVAGSISSISESTDLDERSNVVKPS